jgi:hypothetical protein
MSDQTPFFQELKEMLLKYLDAKIRLLKLEAFEKTAKVTATLFSSIVITLLAFFLLFFLSLSGGFLFGSIFDNNALGFLFIAGIYVLFLIIIIIGKKGLLEKHIIDRVIKQLEESDDNHEE